MSIASKLTLINESKIAIKEAIESKGVSVGSAPLSEYASKIESIDTSGVTTYLRPSEWPEIASLVEPVNDSFVGLFAVYDHGSNHCALQINTDGGDLFISWGDGTTQTGAAGIFVKTFDYSNTSLVDTSYGYKIAVIKITPIASRLVAINLSISGARTWLDIDFQGRYITSLALEALITLQKVRVRDCYISSLDYTFKGCSNLIQLEEFNSRVAVSGAYCAFQNCVSLKLLPEVFVVPLSPYVFRYCRSLETIPDTMYALSSIQAFQGCVSMKRLNISGSYSLNLSYAFESMSALEYIKITVPSINNLEATFCNCWALKEIDFDTSVFTATKFNESFMGCYSLNKISDMDVTTGTNFSTLFYNCFALTKIPFSSTPNGNNFSNFISASDSIQEIPEIDFRGWANSVSINGSSISRIKALFRADQNITMVSLRLSTTALVEVFNNLPTASGSPSINITNNPGSSILTSGERAIATGKGWTIVG